MGNLNVAMIGNLMYIQELSKLDRFSFIVQLHASLFTFIIMSSA